MPVTVCVPVLRVDVVNVATPDAFRGCATSALPLSLKVRVPVGIPDVDGVTVAVNVTDCPGGDGLGDELTTTVVGACCKSSSGAGGGSAVDVLELKFESPE